MKRKHHRGPAIKIEAFGIKLSLQEWAKVLEVGHRLLDNRYRSGWTGEQIITQPINCGARIKQKR
jgi:hypothetical protein